MVAARHTWAWLALAVLSAVSGCATYADRLASVQEQFQMNQLAAADETLDKGMRRRGDRDVLSLDRAMLQLAEGKPKEAEQTLRDVRDRFDALDRPAPGKKAISMLTDANHDVYRGEDYEQVLIRVFLSLSNLMSDGQDAGAYALQVADKQQQIINAGVDEEGNNPKAAYQRVAAGAYLSGALREATHSNYDDVQRSCLMVCSWQPDFPFAAQDLERAKHGHHSAPGNGVVYVFALVGVGPHKEECAEIASTVSLLIADRIISALGDETLPPTIAPVKVPKVVRTEHEVGSVGIGVDGRPIGQTATITDIGTMAVQQYEAIYPRVIAEAVVRRIVKKGVVYGTKKVVGVDKESPVGLLFDLAGVAWEATESADTRCWGLLPDKIQVLRLELPAGQHTLSFQSLGYSGQLLGHRSEHTVNVENGRNTYVLGNFPYGNLVGQVLTNTP
ncbi:MAG: hypothetical protein JSS27_05985 [Planctomycetes bacterium]|nr:hypothetical protein [Planctomycetota bacterium]